MSITTLILPFIDVVDLFAHVDSHTTIVDFKTSSSGYDGHEASLSDQLTAYGLAEPQAEKVALCVFVKTKEPQIQWHFAERSPSDVVDYLDKVRLVVDDIAEGKFYKRPGKHCAYCDFLPVCLGVRRRSKKRWSGLLNRFGSLFFGFRHLQIAFNCFTKSFFLAPMKFSKASNS